jgi:repressor LexA
MSTPPEMLTVPSELVRGERNFVLRVTKGMPSEGIAEGDYLIVSPRQSAQPGEMVIATVDDGVSTMRKFHPEGDDVRLEGATSTEIVAAHRVHIHGVVSGLIRKWMIPSN